MTENFQSKTFNIDNMTTQKLEYMTIKQHDRVTTLHTNAPIIVSIGHLVGNARKVT